MQPPNSSDDLVISTPERVAFQYEIAGIGSRFLAQFVDMAIISLVLLVITILAAALAGLFSSPEIAGLVALILVFILLVGYFMVSEIVWNGQTLGKRAARLRTVGDRGEPLTVGQAAIRNLVRLVDFLPLFYGIGVLTLFINGKGKRLGDFAAGTLVVHDRERISLFDLASTSAAQAPAPPPVASIWSSPSSDATAPVLSQPLAAAPPPVELGLRRLVVAYAARREQLPLERRRALAQSAEPALRKALPEIVAAQGPLAALDVLAEREGISPLRPIHRNARSAMTWGVTALVFCWMPLIAFPAGILSIVFGNDALHAIHEQPDRAQGEDRARTGRLLAIIGLSITALLTLILILAIVSGVGNSG